MAVTWTSAQTDNPGDQWGTSRTPGAEWLVGPGGAAWSVELIVRDEHGAEVSGLSLGSFPTEADAKHAADRHESA